MVYSYAAANDPLYVSEGDYVQFKFKAPSTWATTQTVTIQIGDLTQYWSIITVPQDFTPDPFPFTNVEDAELSTMYVWADGTRSAETITTITGLTDTTQAAVSLTSNIGSTTDDYSIRFDYDGDGTWDTGWIHTDGSQTVVNGAKIQIRGTTSPFNNTPLRLTLAVGTSNETWRITTKAVPQNKPEPFPDYTDLIDQPSNTYCYSEVIRIQGLNSPGPISMTNGGEYGISTTGNTFTNNDGFTVLSDTLFTGAQGTIQNGDYLQLRILSASTGLTPIATDLSIADVSGGDTWSVTTDANPSTTPNSFSFPDIADAIEDFLQPSDPRPVGGLTGLGIPVQVELVDDQTTASEVKIKINDGSIGVFPATVDNGDIITLYARSSATFGDNVTATIKVGSRQIATWTVVTNTGPDTTAVFTPPTDRNNQVPNTFVSSAPITVSGINRPITIEVLSGYDALISIDYDTPVAGPRIFDPSVNSSFYLVIKSATQLNTPEFTEVSVGTGSSNNPFTWTVRTYASVPPSAAQLGVWYSKKTEKFDGYQVGTVLPILKEGVADYGNLQGTLASRYPGFIVCEGQSLDAAQYGPLFDVIGNTYGGNGIRNETEEGVITYTGSFNLPDYRNRRLCGVGVVDSSRGNSAFLPVSTVGKGITDVGAQGGYWYFDKVDSFGVQPLEQIQGPPTSTSGLNSQFFSLGTVRLEGLETITDSVTFSINGLVTAQIGPLNDVIVAAPDHNHAFISAVVESDGGEPLIPWNPQKAMFGTGSRVPGGNEDSRSGDYRAEDVEMTIEAWETWLGTITNFAQELQVYYGGDFNLRDWIVDNLPTGDQRNQNTPFNGDTSWGEPQNDYDVPEIEFLVWWTSAVSALDSASLQDVGSGGGIEQCAVIDTEPVNFRIDNYTPTTGNTLSHSHLITENSVPNPQTDFTGGNLSGAGSQADPFGSGLGAGVEGSIQTFRLWTKRDEFSNRDDGGAYVNRSIGDWAYRLAGGPDNANPNGYWTSPDDIITREDDLIYSNDQTGPQNGSGARIRWTATPWPSVNGNYPYGDTRYKVDLILSSGQNYQVGDKLTVEWWNNLEDTGDRMFEVTAVGQAGTGGAATNIQVTFTQNDIFMDMTDGLFEFTSSFKKPTPIVTMRPQRQVPIINPFHKTKYIIKAY